jgi:hypothetical protein
MSLLIFVMLATSFSAVLLTGLLAMASLFSSARHPYVRFTNAVQEIEEFGAPHEFDAFEPESEPLRRAE